jgi:hypothetical protein
VVDRRTRTATTSVSADSAKGSWVAP